MDLVRFTKAMMLLPAHDEGRWDDCVRLADAFIAECEAGTPHTAQASVHCHRGSIRLARNETEGAIGDAERALELVRDARQPDRVFLAFEFAARAFAESGAVERARGHAADFLSLARSLEPPSWSYIHFAWVATELGCAEELDRLLARQKRQTKWILVTRAVVRGEYAEAAELFAQMGTRPYEAYARLRAAEHLVAEGRRADADEQLEKALAFFRSVRATRYIRAAEALLPAAVERGG